MRLVRSLLLMSKSFSYSEPLRLLDELPGEWRMTISEYDGSTYYLRLIFEKNEISLIGRQIIHENDIREFYQFDIQEIISLRGERYETIHFLRVMDGLDYEATFCYGNMLIGTHSKGKGNWQALKLPYTSPATETIPVAAACLAEIALPPPPIPTHTHLISFNVKLNSYAPSYACIPLCRGQPHPNWVWSVYIYGNDAENSGSAGQVQVFGYVTGSNQHTQLSPVSEALALNQEYRIRWSYTELNGGQLWINDEIQGVVPYRGPLDTTRAPTDSVSVNTIPYQSTRYHSVIAGTVTRIQVEESS